MTVLYIRKFSLLIIFVALGNGMEITSNNWRDFVLFVIIAGPQQQKLSKAKINWMKVYAGENFQIHGETVKLRIIKWRENGSFKQALNDQ